MDEAINVLDNFKTVADSVVNLTAENEREAQDFILNLHDNAAYTDDFFREIIQNGDHSNSIYCAISALSKRLLTYPNRYSSSDFIAVSRIILDVTQNEKVAYFVRNLALKKAVTIVILNYFNDVVWDKQKNRGPLFQYLFALQSQKLGTLVVIQFMDEFLYQVCEEWRLCANNPYDHFLAVKKNIVGQSLGYFVEVALSIGEYLIEKLKFEENTQFAQHLCDFLTNALKFSINENNPNNVFDVDRYLPPLSFKTCILQLNNFSFYLHKFVQEDDGLAIQTLRIINRLSYASGPLFKNMTELSKYRSNFIKAFDIFLPSIRLFSDNIYPLVKLLSTFTAVLYDEASFDRNIVSFAVKIKETIVRIVPIFIEKFFDDDDYECRKIAEALSKCIQNLSKCLQDDDESGEIFVGIMNDLLMGLVSRGPFLKHTVEKRNSCKAFANTMIDVATLKFKTCFESLLTTGIESCNDLNEQRMTQLYWIFYLMADIQKRSFMAHPDYENFKLFIKAQHDEIINDLIEDGAAVNAEQVIRDIHLNSISACEHALNGRLPELFTSVDCVTAIMSFTLWWLKKTELGLDHQNPQMQPLNADVLSATFWCLSQSIEATWDPKAETYAGQESSQNYVAKPPIIPCHIPFFEQLVKYLVDKIFKTIAIYRNFPHLVDEALLTLKSMIKCGYFHLQLRHLMNYLATDMTEFPKRRKLFAIAAQAAYDSVDVNIEQFVTVILAPYQQKIEALSQHVDPNSMIMVLEIFTGFADALLDCEHPCYGALVTQLFFELSKLYPLYKENGDVVYKILEFITVAIPRVIFFNISSGNIENTAEAIIGFMRFYCRHNFERWQYLDNHTTSQSYEDMVLLMEIIKDSLDRLALSSCYEGSDDCEMKVIERLGNLCIEVFIPLFTPIRAAVPAVLQAFLNMLQSVAEYNISSIISNVDHHHSPLPRILYESITSNQSAELIGKTLNIISFILERQNMVFTKKPWRDFFRIILNNIFEIVIHSYKDDSLYLISRDCLFYIIHAEKRYFLFYAQELMNQQIPEMKTDLYKDFCDLCEIGNGTMELCRREFINKYTVFRRKIMGKLRFNAAAVDMEILRTTFIRYVGDNIAPQ